jgi:hypothetical protein
MTITTRSGLRRRITIAGTVLVLTAAGVTGVAGVANAATTTASVATVASSASPSPSKPSTAELQQIRTELRTVLKALPKSLRTDLHAAVHQKSSDARHAALVKVEQKALSGGYGTTAQTLAKDVQSDWASAPSAFEQRVEHLGSGHRGSRVLELRHVLRRALAGKFGTTIQHQLASLASSLPAPSASPSPSSGS